MINQSADISPQSSTDKGIKPSSNRPNSSYIVNNAFFGFLSKDFISISLLKNNIFFKEI